MGDVEKFLIWTHLNIELLTSEIRPYKQNLNEDMRMDFPVQIEVKKDPDFDMTVECIHNDVQLVNNAATSGGFKLTAFGHIPGTQRIADSVVYTVTGGTFDEFASALRDAIAASGQIAKEEDFSNGVSGAHLVFNFENRPLLKSR